MVDSNKGKLSEPLQVLLCITQALCGRLGQLYSPELMHHMKYVRKYSSDIYKTILVSPKIPMNLDGVSKAFLCNQLFTNCVNSVVRRN